MGKPTMAVDTDTVDTAVDMEVMVDTVARDQLKLKLMPGMAVDTVDTVMVDMEVMVMEVMGDTDTVPDTVLELTDTVPDTVPDTDSAMLDTVPDTVSDTATVDTVERDLLMPGTDAVMVVMVDTAVDTVMVDTVLDTDTDVDTDTRFLSNQLTKETILYKIMPL